ncbi:MAG: sugar ABC transporter permease [Treponema sp.]|jgi:ABC-type sugar transport system permease subunit|nr:sugar ABC transporter permease [Treponema sp.]
MKAVFVNTGNGRGARLSIGGKRAVTGLLFISPFLIGFLAFMAIPLFQSLAMAFSEVGLDNVKHAFTLSFRGLGNFNNAFFVDAGFNRSLVSELMRMLAFVPSVIIFSIFTALLMNQEFWGRAFARTVFFMPVILSAGVFASIEASTHAASSLLDMARSNFYVGGFLSEIVQEILQGINNNLNVNIAGYVLLAVSRVYTIAMASGIQVVIFLSALQGIPPSMYEAAELEGCGKWECFWKVTFPLLVPQIFVVVVYSIVDFLTGGINAVMNNIAGDSNRFRWGEASAKAWIYMALVIAILGIITALLSKKVRYND